MSRYLELKAEGPSDESDTDSIELLADEPSPRVAARVARAAALSNVPVVEAKEVDEGLESATSDLESKAKFRLNASRVLITYPQAPPHWTKEHVQAHIKLRLPAAVESMVVARELHRDGSPHFHVLVSCVKKMDITNVRHFDLEEKHPNFRTVKRGKDHFFTTAEYCMKGGDFISDNLNLFPNSKNFRKKQADHEAWIEHVNAKNSVAVRWPWVLPEGTVMQKPSDPETSKRRHVWLYGASDLGKTTWLHDTFAGQKIYIASTSTFAFDSYNGEEIIVFDDVALDSTYKELICAMSGYFRVKSPLPPTRYHQKFWPINQLRTIIVICNDPPGADLDTEGWFTNRFLVVHVTSQNRVPRALPAVPVLPSRSSSVIEEYEYAED